jgi:kynurenine formamidase
MTAPPPRGRVVDLSLTLAEELPCSFPGHVPFQHKVFNWFGARPDPVAPVTDALGPYHTRWLMLDEHTGTHFDAPAHAIPPPGSGLPGADAAGAVTSEQVPPELSLGPCVVLDARPDVAADAARAAPGARPAARADVAPAAPGASPWIGVEALERFEAEHGPLAAGEIVLLRTGWDAHYVAGPAGDAYVRACAGGAPTAPAWPAPTPELITALADRGVRCLGTDGVSIGAAHDPGPGHRTGLLRRMVYVECLTGLAALPARGAWFAFLPLKVRGGSGAPGRAIAIVPEEDG